ncbi:unnamed protein product [Durusdinium trenchii]|uniref:Tyrosine specific protein phosphatases domain-containing protein n=1 Tax=Durusdinium trenchii TaxID=1381693 RepID=A0ABP0RTI5_9DINO
MAALPAWPSAVAPHAVGATGLHGALERWRGRSYWTPSRSSHLPCAYRPHALLVASPAGAACLALVCASLASLRRSKGSLDRRRRRCACAALPKLPPVEGRAEQSPLAFSDMANWLSPGTLMVGRYPMLEKNKDACRRHLRRLVTEAKISTFVCVQSEVPSQLDMKRWPPGGVDVRRRRCLPYAPLARQFAKHKLHFLHEPMEDLATPGHERLETLSQDLEARAHKGERILVHCMGGRGRSNLVAGCVLARLYGLPAEEVLQRLQFGYDARNYDNCLVPETSRQRELLMSFCHRAADG